MQESLRPWAWKILEEQTRGHGWEKAPGGSSGNYHYFCKKSELYEWKTIEYTRNKWGILEQEQAYINDGAESKKDNETKNKEVIWEYQE